MPWLLTSPGHQQPRYWLCRTTGPCRPPGRISITCAISVSRKCKYVLSFFPKHSEPKGLRTAGDHHITHFSKVNHSEPQCQAKFVPRSLSFFLNNYNALGWNMSKRSVGIKWQGRQKTRATTNHPCQKLNSWLIFLASLLAGVFFWKQICFKSARKPQVCRCSRRDWQAIVNWGRGCHTVNVCKVVRVWL